MTDHVKNQLCARIEELEAEKLALLEENAALAAHVERSAKALNYCNDYLNDNALNSIGHGSKAHCEIRDALEDNPAAKPKEVRYEPDHRIL